jgi:eukaryotic-like serine/threonine-protein kinase
VLYELLTGRPPFRGMDALDTMAQVREREPVRPQTISPAIDRDLETICLKCLAKDAAGRYGSAEALAEDLERWRCGEPILARPVGRMERARKWVRRNPAKAGLIAVTALFLLAAVGGGVALGYSRTLEEKNRDLAAAKDDADGQRREADKQRLEAEKQRERARSEELRARRFLYVSRMTLAQQAERDNQPARVIELLKSVIPNDPDQEDLRGWEWHHLWRKHQGEQSRLLGHTGIVLAVAFSPIEYLLASAGADQTIKIWDLKRGQVVSTLLGHADSVSAIAFSPDGRRLVSTGADKTVRLWEIGTGKELLMLEGHTATVNCVAFSQEGHSVVTGSDDKQLRVWDLRNGTAVTVFKEHAEKVETLAFDPKGRFVISGDSKGIKVWNPLTAAEIPGAPRLGATMLALNAKGERLALAGNTPNLHIRILEVASWKEITSIEVPNVSVTQLAFSPDGTRLAASCLDEKVRVWDAQSGKEVSVQHTENAARAVAYSRDGQRLATGTNNRLAMI